MYFILKVFQFIFRSVCFAIFFQLLSNIFEKSRFKWEKEFAENFWKFHGGLRKLKLLKSLPFPDGRRLKTLKVEKKFHRRARILWHFTGTEDWILLSLLYFLIGENLKFQLRDWILVLHSLRPFRNYKDWISSHEVP